MSITARILIGLAGFAAGVAILCLPVVVPTLHPPNWDVLIVAVGTCFLIPIACLGGGIGQVAVRTLGALAFIASAYNASQVDNPQRPVLAAKQSGTTFLDAIAGLVIWGLPGALIAINGTKWLSDTFQRGESIDDERDADEQDADEHDDDD